MTEDNTTEMKDSRTFEERVFLRFDAMDARFNAIDTRFERIETRLDSLDGRVEKLEAKQYDTKPIWEQALAAISGVDARMKDGFESLKEQMENSIHGVEWQIDALNQNILKVQADQRYFDKRLRDVEATLRQP